MAHRHEQSRGDTNSGAEAAGGGAPGGGAGGEEGADLSFDEALVRLESIIERMESRDAGLEESLAGYERGVRLLRHCRDVLKRAEDRVEELNRVLDGSPGEGRASK